MPTKVIRFIYEESASVALFAIGLLVSLIMAMFVFLPQINKFSDTLGNIRTQKALMEDIKRSPLVISAITHDTRRMEIKLAAVQASSLQKSTGAYDMLVDIATATGVKFLRMAPLATDSKDSSHLVVEFTAPYQTMLSFVYACELKHPIIEVENCAIVAKKNRLVDVRIGVDIRCASRGRQ